MKHLRAMNHRARQISGLDEPDVYGYACSDCCTAWAPGWETGQDGRVDPCPWASDLSLCWGACYWSGQVPDYYGEPGWLDACGNLAEDWYRICVVPDN